jgi:hypothetical protein
MTRTEDVFLKMALDAWNIQIDRTTKLIETLDDDQLQREVAPGRNTGVYLLGHLTAVHDALFPLMRFGDRLYADLDKVFVKNPDKSGLSKPPIGELRASWQTVNRALAQHFNSLSIEQWLERHAAVSEADFEREPHRNRLNVVLNRTSHLANHLGQLTFLKQIP